MRGLEPDQCFAIGDAVRPTVPDLAIEVIWTSGGIDKLEVYRKLGVREVWFWKAHRLEVYVLKGEQYRRARKSRLVPEVDLDLLVSFVDEPVMSRAKRGLRAAIRKRRR
jgi:Uma2 family endonuclease